MYWNAIKSVATRQTNSSVLSMDVNRSSIVIIKGFSYYFSRNHLFLNDFIYRTFHVNKVHKKTYRCDWPQCHYIASNSKTLSEHKSSHTGITPYVCDWPECGFMARNTLSLKHHKYIHTGERPYPCTWPGCGKTYAYLSSKVFLFITIVLITSLEQIQL